MVEPIIYRTAAARIHYLKGGQGKPSLGPQRGRESWLCPYLQQLAQHSTVYVTCRFGCRIGSVLETFPDLTRSHLLIEALGSACLPCSVIGGWMAAAAGLSAALIVLFCRCAGLSTWEIVTSSAWTGRQRKPAFSIRKLPQAKDLFTELRRKNENSVSRIKRTPFVTAGNRTCTMRRGPSCCRAYKRRR